MLLISILTKPLVWVGYRILL